MKLVDCKLKMSDSIEVICGKQEIDYIDYLTKTENPDINIYKEAIESRIRNFNFLKNPIYPQMKEVGDFIMSWYSVEPNRNTFLENFNYNSTYKSLSFVSTFYDNTHVQRVHLNPDLSYNSFEIKVKTSTLNENTEIMMQYTYGGRLVSEFVLSWILIEKLNKYMYDTESFETRQDGEFTIIPFPMFPNKTFFPNTQKKTLFEIRSKNVEIYDIFAKEYKIKELPTKIVPFLTSCLVKYDDFNKFDVSGPYDYTSSTFLWMITFELKHLCHYYQGVKLFTNEFTEIETYYFKKDNEVIVFPKLYVSVGFFDIRLKLIPWCKENVPTVKIVGCWSGFFDNEKDYCFEWHFCEETQNKMVVLTNDAWIYSHFNPKIYYQKRFTPDQILKTFGIKLCGENVFRTKNLPETLLRENLDNFDSQMWKIVSVHQTLSRDFIREFKDKVFWEGISKDQILSEDFIREFKDFVDWKYISKCQTLSETFIEEFKDRVDWGFIYYVYCHESDKLSYLFKYKFKESLKI